MSQRDCSWPYLNDTAPRRHLGAHAKGRGAARDQAVMRVWLFQGMDSH